MSEQVLDRVLEKRPPASDQVIEALQDVQEACGYVPREAMEGIAERAGVPVMEVYRAATFYKAISLEPRGEHMLVLCTGTACHVRGAPRLLQEATALLGVEPGRTTDDGLFTVESVNCLGACALGPVVVLDGEYHDHMTPGKLQELIESVREEEEGEAEGD